MSVTAPADRRFRRSRIPAARRRRAHPVWRVVKIVVIVGVLTGAGSWAAGAAAGLPWLRVQHIRVHGNQRVHAGEVAALLEGMKGQSLLAVDLERWRSRLFASAWVADATLRRRLPGTIDVELRERLPMGLARAGTDLFLVDAAGTVIDEYGPRYADCDLPIIDGIVVVPVSVPPVIDRLRGQLVSRLMAELRTRPELAGRVSQIDAGNVHDVHVILDGDPAVVRLGETQFVERLESYVNLQAALREQVPDIDYVDVRFGERVFVGITQEAGAARRRAAPRSPRATQTDGGNGSSGFRTRARGAGGSLNAGSETGPVGGAVGRKERHLVGLDLGTSKVAAIVGEIMGNGEVEIIGLGVAESQGIRRGAVVNQEAAVESIRKAVEAAELTAGIEIDNAYVSLSGTHIKGFNSRGVVAVAGRNREITRDDVRRAIDAARAVSLPGGREILHVLPQDFVVDDEDGIGNPIGMTGARLEVNVHIVTGGTTTTQNIVTCVNRAGVNVQESVLEQLAASDAVLTPDEKELGVAVIDIGGGTTDVAIFERGFLWHTAVAPIGGDHFTSDIAVGLRMPIPEAEKLKRRCGCALSSMVGDDETMDVASVGGRAPRTMARRILSEVLQPRAEEMCHLVWDEVHRAGYEKSLNSGIVLTGGGANLEGMTEIAEQIFDMPVRRGAPAGLGGLADHVGNPSFATAVGLLLRAHRLRTHELAQASGRGIGRLTELVKGVFKEFL